MAIGVGYLNRMSLFSWAGTKGAHVRFIPESGH
jgi:hypothetical protein